MSMISLKPDLRKFLRYWMDVYRQFISDQCPMHAASLSFTTLLSLVPLTAVAFGVLSAFPAYREYAGNIQSWVIDQFVASSADVIKANLQSFVSNTAKLSATGFFFLLVAAVLMIFSMESAFNIIWRVRERRHGLAAFLMYWAVLTLIPILIGVGIAVSSYLLTLPYLAGTAEALNHSSLFIHLLPFFSTWLAFSVLYVALPNKKIYWQSGMLGGFVAALLFELAKKSFGLYITFFPTYQLLYGALAIIPLFLIWLYVSWSLILLGAVVGYNLQKD